MLRYVVAAALLCASLHASEIEESVHRTVPVFSATHLRLNADVGNINVKPSDGHTVDVEVFFRGDPPSRREFDRMLHDFSLKTFQQGSEITVDGEFLHGWEPLISYLIDGGFFSHGSHCRNWHCLIYSAWLDEVEFRVTVPRQFDTNLTSLGGGSISVSQLKGEVTARTSGGWLSFDRVEGPVNGSTSGGGIVLLGVKGRSVVHTSGGGIRISDASGDVDASTSGGWISIDTASGRIKAHTSGGWINARAISGSIDASTSGGGVTVALAAQPRGECRVYTSGGWISVSLPGDAHVDLDASTSGGWVATDFPVPDNGPRPLNTLRAPLNGGGPLVSLHTSGGWIHIKRT